MLKNHTLIVCLALLLASSCNNTTPQQEDASAELPFEEVLLGTWETIEMETRCPTYLGQDTTVHQLIEEADWSKRYGTKPARTLYTPDGKLKRSYYNVKGEMTDITHGIWKAVGPDSLFVIEPNTTLSYKHSFDGSLLTLTGLVDWDFDGEEDDDFRAVMRLVSRTD